MDREIDEELAAHLEEAAANGRDAAEARRSLGSPLRLREQSRDIRLLPWLDSLGADAVFGWRQLKKRKVTSAAAILSLALGIGASIAAFRLVDAVLLRPLPVAHADRLYNVARTGVGFDGKFALNDSWAYPGFRLMSAAVKDQADLIAVSDVSRMDLTYQSSPEIEKAGVQYVSGRMFGLFGLRPSIGRLLSAHDDLEPGAHPYAVLSYDYWARRFARDPKIVGQTFHLGDQIYEIVGVGPESFTGTTTGTVTDIFIPTMMHPAVTHDDWTWHRTLALLKPGVAIEPVRAKLHATEMAFERERAKSFVGITQENIEKFLNFKVELLPARAGASTFQQNYRSSLVALVVLVALVLLIACANVANLMAAQATARAREMALRVSIGAGRLRLIQLMLVESSWIAALAALGGALFAWWCAPFVVSKLNPPNDPIHLALPADWRVLGFGLALIILVALALGLAPAWRASSIQPANALKGGGDPRSRRRLMHALVAAQVAFCFVVLFATGLFAATFEKLSRKPLGFVPDRLLTVEATTAQAQSSVYWDQEADHLRALPGVENVALCGWPLLSGNAWNGFIMINGGPPSSDLVYFVNVSPGWIDTMKIGWIAGRDFLPNETSPGAAIVNETLARQYFKGQDPLGRAFYKSYPHMRFVIVGVVRDSPYRDVHEATLPVAYVPFRPVGGDGASQSIRTATFVVRTAARNPLAIASLVRHEIPRANPAFRVSNIGTETDLVNAQTVRERLLAMLGEFFGTVSLLLAGIGLYGVLDYTALERRREIGIRIALGARAAQVAANVTTRVFTMVIAGAIAGLGLGLFSARYIRTLLYDVKPSDPGALIFPAAMIFAIALIASLVPAMRAVRLDPAATLRSE